MIAWDSTCSGTGTHLNTYSASSNGGKEWMVGPGQIDDGGKVFSIPPQGGTFSKIG
jgi:hypothetical protein